MKLTISISCIILALALVSCEKETKITEEDPLTYLRQYKDSCSYTIDGKVFIADIWPASNGGGIGKTNFDSATGTYDADSMQYFNRFSLRGMTNGSPSAFIQIHFLKTYGNDQLVQSAWFPHLKPANIMDLYTLGEHSFALDYQRFRSQDGVVIHVRNYTPTVANPYGEDLISYIQAPYNAETTISPAIHNTSNFEIIKVTKLPDDTHVVEAKFSANVFNNQEEVKRVENGYIRFRVDQFFM